MLVLRHTMSQDNGSRRICSFSMLVFSTIIVGCMLCCVLFTTCILQYNENVFVFTCGCCGHWWVCSAHIAGMHALLSFVCWSLQPPQCQWTKYTENLLRNGIRNGYGMLSPATNWDSSENSSATNRAGCFQRTSHFSFPPLSNAVEKTFLKKVAKF